MVKKTDKFLTILDDNVVPILGVNGEEKDPNWQDVQSHDLSNYLRERYWIKQSGPTKRWNNRKFFNVSGSTELRISDLGRKLDDPGDAFYELFLSTSRHTIHLRTWFEVTEVFLPEQAKMVNRFIREYNGLLGKGEIDAAEFLKSLDFGSPNSRLQCDMADRVIAAIEKKSKKGSYKPLVRDYGRGQLIVGLPLWFATFPSNPTIPSNVHKDFATRLQFAFKEIENSVLRTNWCPFDSIVVLWDPTLESIDEWVRVADLDFYSDPANLSWKTPISLLKLYSSFRDPSLPKPNRITHNARWDRYSSLDDMLIDQRKWLRLPNNPRPLAPKARLKIDRHENNDNTLNTFFFSNTYFSSGYLFASMVGVVFASGLLLDSLSIVYTPACVKVGKHANFIVLQLQIVPRAMIMSTLINVSKVAAKRTIPEHLRHFAS